VIGEAASQFLFTYYFPAFTRTSPLTLSEWGGCLAVGASPLGVAALLKMTPIALFDRMKVDKLIDENKASEENAMMKAYNNTKKIKVTDFKKGNTKKDEEDDNFGKV